MMSTPNPKKDIQISKALSNCGFFTPIKTIYRRDTTGFRNGDEIPYNSRIITATPFQAALAEMDINLDTMLAPYMNKARN